MKKTLCALVLFLFGTVGLHAKGPTPAQQEGYRRCDAAYNVCMNDRCGRAKLKHFSTWRVCARRCGRSELSCMDVVNQGKVY
jgi:hypothetical protein